MTNPVEREVSGAAKRGPLFFRRDGVTYFQFTADASSVIGPRRATKQDQIDHPFAWEQFAGATDLDGDGDMGGSLPKEQEPPKRRGRPPKAR